MYSDEAIKRFWEETRPSNVLTALFYLHALRYILSISEESRYKEPFYSPKKSGGQRTIRQATYRLYIVQKYLSRWIQKTITFYDYFYKGPGRGGSLRAASTLKNFTGGICIDLASAFDQVTDEFIRKRFQGILKSDLLKIFIEIVTYHGAIPQGCTSSIFVFDAVMGPVDVELLELKRKYPHLVGDIVRYTDNICITVINSKPEILDWMARMTLEIITKHGFKGRYVKHYRPPLNYLGLFVFPKRVELNRKKFDEIVKKVVLAGRSSNPSKKRKSVMGLLGWVMRVYGDQVPIDLIEMFERFFKKAPPIPEKLTMLKEKKLS